MEQIPWVAGFPFFIVTFFSSFIDLFDLHLTQYASMAMQAVSRIKRVVYKMIVIKPRWTSPDIIGYIRNLKY